MDSQLDAQPVMEFRVEGEAQEFIILSCAVTELKSALGRREDNPRVVRFEARQEEEATGLPQTVGVSVPKILYGYQSDRPFDAPESCRVWAREDEEAINFKTTLAEGPEWRDVVWRVTRRKSDNQIVSSRAIDPNSEGSEWNAPLPSKQL